MEVPCQALRDTPLHYDFQVVRATLVCFSVAPSTRTCYMLLGQERHDRQWCDFGGQVEGEETSAETAAREFAEESLGVVRFSDTLLDLRGSEDVPAMYIDALATELASHRFLVRLSLKQNEEPGVRVFFLKEVPWQPDLSTRFQWMMTRLCSSPRWSAHPALQSVREEESDAEEDEVRRPEIRLRPEWREKVSIEWWSFDRLKQVLRNDGHYKGERFRRCFLPILDMMLRYLSRPDF